VLTIAVIGAGAAGRDFAIACAAAGFQVVPEDVMPEKLRNAAAAFAEIGQAVRLVMTVEDAVRDADLAVDFVPDDLESKLEIWSMIDRMAPPKTVMLTPSEALSITDLASCTYRGDRCVMARGGFVGATRLLSASATSDETRAVASQVLRGIGCTVTAESDPDLPMLLKNMRALQL
jgi:3-hydroxybutyryl-CoA dehydrogenase